MVGFALLFVAVTAYAFPRRDIPAPS